MINQHSHNIDELIKGFKNYHLRVHFGEIAIRWFNDVLFVLIMVHSYELEIGIKGLIIVSSFYILILICNIYIERNGFAIKNFIFLTCVILNYHFKSLIPFEVFIPINIFFMFFTFRYHYSKTLGCKISDINKLEREQRKRFVKEKIIHLNSEGIIMLRSYLQSNINKKETSNTIFEKPLTFIGVFLSGWFLNEIKVLNIRWIDIKNIILFPNHHKELTWQLIGMFTLRLFGAVAIIYCIVIAMRFLFNYLLQNLMKDILFRDTNVLVELDRILLELLLEKEQFTN